MSCEIKINTYSKATQKYYRLTTTLSMGVGRQKNGNLNIRSNRKFRINTRTSLHVQIHIPMQSLFAIYMLYF